MPQSDEIIERLAAGETLRGICNDDGMPSPQSVLRRVDSDPEFAERYARARKMGLDVLADEIITISDTCREGQKTKTLPNGTEEVTTGDMVERSRLQIDARKWLLARLRPDKYGDSIKQEISGSAGGPVVLNIIGVPPKQP